MSNDFILVSFISTLILLGVYGHSATLIGDHMYVFGGHDGKWGWDEPSNDLYVLEIASFKWSKLQLSRKRKQCLLSVICSKIY